MEDSGNTEERRTILEHTPRAPSASAGNAPVPTSRYREIEPLARGGMGEIYRAVDPELGRTVAVKVVRDGQAGQAQISRFEREARITAQLEHPNVVPVHEMGRGDGGRRYFSMKLVKGVSLAERLARPSSRGERPRLRLKLLSDFLKICDAVAFAHSRGILHRDLKPANIMLGEFGEVLVMDWGLATVGGREAFASPSPAVFAASEGATQDGAILGTPAYMAPEQAQGLVSAIDARTDVYALGAILYEILTFTPPFRDSSTSRILARVSAGKFEPPSRRDPSVPRELEAAVLRAMARSNADRYSRVEELASDVEAWLHGRPLSAVRYSKIARALKWARRHAVATGVVLAVVASALAFGAFELVRWRAQAKESAARVREIAGLDFLAEARRVLAGVEANPAMRPEPTADEKEAWARILSGLHRLADARADLLRVEPFDDDNRRALQETLLALGRLGEAAEDYTLAEVALERAILLDPGDPEPRERRAGVEIARHARLARHTARIDELLAHAAQGQLRRDVDAWAYQRALLEIASFREPKTAEELVMRLEDATVRMRDATRRTIESADDPDDSIDGLTPALDAWMDSTRPTPAGGPEPAPLAREHRKALAEAFRRLETGSPARHWTQRVATAQREALSAGAGPDGEAVLALVVEALGLLADRRATLSLGRYLWSEFDQARAVPAGLALLALSEVDSRARTVLFELVGIASGQRRTAHWDGNDPFWTAISRHLARSPDLAGPATDSVEDLLHHGLLLQARGNAAGALESLTKVIERRPDWARAWNDRGGVRLQAGDLDGALQDLERSVELDPASAKAFTNRGIVHLARGELAAAREDLDRAVELDPELGIAWLNRGGVLERAGDLDGAIADYTRALEVSPGLSRAAQNRAVVRHRRGELDLALADYDLAIRTDPALVDAYFNRGTIHQVQGRLAAAREDYDRALELDPKLAGAWIHRGTLRGLAGDLEGAVEDIQHAIELDPTQWQAWANLARGLGMVGRREEAVAAARKALELSPADRHEALKRLVKDLGG